MNRTLIALMCLLLVVGCSKHFVITSELSQPLTDESCVQIAEVQDMLPEDMEESDRPSVEDIARFKAYLVEEFANRDELALSLSDEGCPYEVQGALLSYSKGSGFLRFLIGFGAGNAKVTTELKLVDTRDSSTVFAGNFTGQVGSWTDTGDKMFKEVSRNFTKELEKQIKAAVAS